MQVIAVKPAAGSGDSLHVASATVGCARKEVPMTISSKIRTTRDFGSVHGSPDLPAGFADRFESRLLDIDGVTLHAVVGGKGPPLLLLGGWPQNWYIWRDLMPALSEQFTVVAADPRGVGLSDKTPDGYDSGTQARDMAALMEALGHARFAMVGHDVGGWTAYALAADMPEKIERVVVGETGIPGILPPIPLLVEPRFISDRLWHMNFNRAHDINEAMVRGREEIYFGYQLQSKGGSPDALPEPVRRYYIELLKRDDGSLKASFDFYRAIDDIIPQNAARKTRMLDMPVFTYAGELFAGDFVEQDMRGVATNVASIVFAGVGHHVPEEAPQPLLDALTAFLTPWAESGK